MLKWNKIQMFQVAMIIPFSTIIGRQKLESFIGRMYPTTSSPTDLYIIHIFKSFSRLNFCYPNLAL